MGIFDLGIKRAHTGELRKEDSFFPYYLDEIQEIYSLSSSDQLFPIGIYEPTKHKRIAWFIQDYSGKTLAFGSEMCEFLKKTPFFVKAYPSWCQHKEYDIPFIGTITTSTKNTEEEIIKNLTSENSILIYKDTSMDNTNAFKIL